MKWLMNFYYPPYRRSEGSMEEVFKLHPEFKTFGYKNLSIGIPQPTFMYTTDKLNELRMAGLYGEE
jgi:hypothetical protein